MSKKKTNETLSSKTATTGPVFEEQRKTVKELIAPVGVANTAPDYIIVHDSGRNLFVSSMYIHKLPKSSQFATTYAQLINFPDVVTSIFIDPIPAQEAQRMIDRRVTTTSMSESETIKSGNRNDIRRAAQKRIEAEQWANYLETGTNSLYYVQFLFTFYAESENSLRHMLASFVDTARRHGIDAVSCYCCQKEAFMSAFPLNKVQTIKGTSPIIKKHVFERESLGDIFNHTSNTFSHSNGVFLGHYIDSLQVFVYDPFDRSHTNYNVVVSGTSGSGKSVLIKLIQSRFCAFGVRSRTLDVESKFSSGEYAAVAKACGGIVFDIKPGSSNILNPFEITDEMEYDEVNDIEFPTLRLNEKLVYLSNLVFSMVMFNGASIDVAMEQALLSIISNICSLLYEERGFEEGNADSVYEICQSGETLSSGRRMKEMPTFTDFYKKTLLMASRNSNQLHSVAYQVLLDALSVRVKEVYYGAKTLTFFSRKEYEALPRDPQTGDRFHNIGNERENIVVVRGVKSYFDGQSTLHASYKTPYIDYNIAQLPADEKPFAMLVVLGYIEEKDIRTNSANPKKMSPLIFLQDEIHMVFPYEKARKIIEQVYRTGRKRFVSPWCATQSITDFKVSQETMSILNNASTLFLLRHKRTAVPFILENTQLNSSQAERILTIGYDPDEDGLDSTKYESKRGEVCVQDSERVAFIKVDYIKSVEAVLAETNMAEVKAERSGKGEK
jgi:hypothetical protein